MFDTKDLGNYWSEFVVLFRKEFFLQLWVVLGAIFRFFSTFLEDSVEPTGTIENAIDLCIYLYRDGFIQREGTMGCLLH